MGKFSIKRKLKWGERFRVKLKWYFKVKWKRKK